MNCAILARATQAVAEQDLRLLDKEVYNAQCCLEEFQHELSGLLSLRGINPVDIQEARQCVSDYYRLSETLQQMRRDLATELSKKKCCL